MKKRVLSMFMALALCLTLLPAPAFAEGTEIAESGAAQVTTADNKEQVYGTFDKAWSAAIKSEGSTLKLLSDVELSNKVGQDGLPVSEGSFTLDLNNKTLQGAIWNQLLEVSGTANITIKNGSLVNTQTGPAASATSTNFVALKISGGTVALDKVNLTSGSNTEGKHSSALYITGGSLTVTGSTFTGEVGVLCENSGTRPALSIADATLNNGIFYWVAGAQASDTAGLEAIFADGSMLFDQNSKYIDLASKEYWHIDIENVVAIFLYTEKCIVKPHTHKVENGACECGATFAASVTQNGTVAYYKDFNEALSAAKAGDTLTLLADVQGGNWVTIDKAITFDLNGHEIYYELTVKCKITLKDSAGGTGKIALWLRVENGLTVGDLLEPGYALRNADTKEWYGETEQTVRNLTVQQVPITSVTLTALNADGTAASTSIPYGTTGGIKLSASCDAKPGAGELSCQWYTIGGTLQLIDGATEPVYQLPADLSVGKHTYRVTFTADGYSKSADITITVTATNKIVPTGEPTLSATTLTYGQALSAIKLSGKLHDNVNNKDVEGTFTWVDSTVKPSAGSYEAAWKFTPADGATYAETTGTVSITVNKATPTGEPIYTRITAANKTLKDAALKPNTSWPSGTIQWVDKDGKELPDTTEVKANTAYKWIFTPTGADADNYTTATGELTLYSVSTGGGGGGSSSGSTAKTDTVTNPDGSVTKTETKKDGTKVETTTAKDGSVTRIETKPDGTVVETTTGKDGSTTKTETKKDGSSVTENKAADGSTGTVKTDKNGQTTAETTLSSKAIEDAKKSGEAIKAPVEVKASRNSNTAPTVKVELPKGTGETKVEIPVSNVKPGTVAVLVHADGTEEIVKNSLPTEDGIQLTVNGGATVKIVDNSKDFADTRNHWAKDAIDFVSARGLVNGMNDSIYAPDASTTRAQLWTILARQNNADLNGGNTWYEKAQLWSKDKGVSDGANPNGTIDRAQMVTMLWRAAGQPTAGGTANFTDVPADSYYANAVSWAVEGGITTGVGGGRFDPNSTCTRGQIATFLWRTMAE